MSFCPQLQRAAVLGRATALPAASLRPGALQGRDRYGYYANMLCA